jgi:hypothetical protein
VELQSGTLWEFSPLDGRAQSSDLGPGDPAQGTQGILLPVTPGRRVLDEVPSICIGRMLFEAGAWKTMNDSLILGLYILELWTMPGPLNFNN